jgi:regulator of protease activity HflC (stomatin/prohibitin superfamily)
MPFEGLDIVVIAIVVLIILVLFAGIKTVKQGFNYTVERFGRYTRTLSPGLNIIVPFLDRVGNKINMMEQVMDVPTQEVITRDNATVAVDGVTFFQILDAAKAAYEVNDLVNAVLNLTMTNIRTVMGSMDLDELLSKRDEINERILRVVDEAVSPWGLKITRIEIKDINPPADLVASMGRQMKAEREKRAQVLEAEGFKQSEILKAEGEKQAVILEAEAAKEAAFREAEARERAAEAEARATQVVSDAIAAGDVQAINYFVAQKYVEALGKIASAPNQKVIMMPLEATAILGSLGGIGEISKDLFGNGGGSGGSSGGGSDGGGSGSSASGGSTTSRSSPRAMPRPETKTLPTGFGSINPSKD